MEKETAKSTDTNSTPKFNETEEISSAKNPQQFHSIGKEVETPEYLFKRAIRCITYCEGKAPIVGVSSRNDVIEEELQDLDHLLAGDVENINYMYYLAYANLRLGRTNEALNFVDDIRTVTKGPLPTAALGLKALIKDSKKQKILLSVVFTSSIAAISGLLYYIYHSKKGQNK